MTTEEASSENMDVKLPLITQAELKAAREKVSKVYVSVDHRKVYDVTAFVDAHPGGGDLILDYAGEDVTEIMKDLQSHEHSDAAYELLDEEYLIAVLATPEEEAKLLKNNPDREFFHGVQQDAEAELSVKTDYSKDWKKNKFLDLNKPLLMQMLFGKFDRAFYLEQVHKPRHYGNGSAPLFGNFLEPLSKTPWWVIPIIWIPADVFVITKALEGLPVYQFIPIYIFGLFLWTLVEYILHRFLFHLDDWLPESQIAFTIHFLLHGVHHYLPMDPLRLVMPPTLLLVIATPLYKLCHVLFPYHVALTVFAGAFLGYVMYDCTHYFLHHTKLPAYLKKLKLHHLDHHYKNYQVGFGVTSRFWDYVFDTDFTPNTKVKL